jgi:hypothetical protein
VYTPNPKYEPLQLMKISGAFAFLFVLLSLSLFALLLEIISSRCTGEMETGGGQIEFHDLHILYDHRISKETWQIIMAMHLKQLALIERDVNQL